VVIKLDFDAIFKRIFSPNEKILCSSKPFIKKTFLKKEIPKVLLWIYGITGLVILICFIFWLFASFIFTIPLGGEYFLVLSLSIGYCLTGGTIVFLMITLCLWLNKITPETWETNYFITDKRIISVYLNKKSIENNLPEGTLHNYPLSKIDYYFVETKTTSSLNFICFKFSDLNSDEWAVAEIGIHKLQDKTLKEISEFELYNKGEGLKKPFDFSICINKLENEEEVLKTLANILPEKLKNLEPNWKKEAMNWWFI